MNSKYFTFKPLGHGKYKLMAPRDRAGYQALAGITNNLWGHMHHKAIEIQTPIDKDYDYIILDDQDLDAIFGCFQALD